MPDKAPVVSIIIPVYNGEKYLRETIDSITSQTLKNWEIIAVNDGSADGSVKILEEYAAKDPDRIRFISVENGGVSRARNSGVSLARGIYIAFIDQDDIWAPDMLQRQVDLLSRNNDLGLVFTNESVIDENGTVIRKNVLRFGACQRGEIFKTLLFDNFVPISSVVVKKELFQKVGGFNPSYSLAEDFDFLLKISRITLCDYNDIPLLYYREHGQSGTHTKIDRITAEALEIIHEYKQKNPEMFRKYYFGYLRFRLKFSILKMKILIKKYFHATAG